MPYVTPTNFFVYFVLSRATIIFHVICSDTKWFVYGMLRATIRLFSWNVMTTKLFFYCFAYCVPRIDGLPLTIVLKLLFLSNLSIELHLTWLLFVNHNLFVEKIHICILYLLHKK
jgi:hypothetical protein